MSGRYAIPTSFLRAITHQKPSDALPQELTEAVEEALQFYKKHLQQKESQLQYFQALANHIDLSVFVYSPETGQVEWMNQAAKIQTGLNFAETIDDLAAYHPELPARLRILHPGELSILQVRRQEDYSQLILLIHVVRGIEQAAYRRQHEEYPLGTGK